MFMHKIRFLFATKKDYKELSDFCKGMRARKSLKKILASKGMAKIAVAKLADGKIAGKALLYILP